MRSRKSFLVLFLLLISKGAFAQYPIADDLLKSNVTAWYDQQIGLQHTLLQHGELVALTRKSPNSYAYYGKSAWVDMHNYLS